MCRWLAYTGSPLLLEEALYSPAYSFIDQSLHSRLGAEATNGDGFGVGWYDEAPRPGIFRSVEPAWNDQNLRELSQHIRSGHFFAHVRAAIGSAVQLTNCHPFRHGSWLWMHNGCIHDFALFKRDVALAIDPSLYPHLAGQTDTEILFHLALTFGLEDDPPARGRAGHRVRRGSRAPRRCGAPLPGDDRDDRRRHGLGLPLLERGQIQVALLLEGRRRVCASASPSGRSCTRYPTTPG